jgi:hypothetical protein
MRCRYEREENFFHMKLNVMRRICGVGGGGLYMTMVKEWERNRAVNHRYMLKHCDDDEKEYIYIYMLSK